MDNILNIIMQNGAIRVVAIFIMLDCFLGVLRAVKEKDFNSSVGINGAIRKSAMIGSILFLIVIDLMLNFNLLGFLPKELLEFINLEKIGIAEFFSIMFVLYEMISCLKNAYLCNLPMPKWLRDKLENLLKNLTGELKEEVVKEENDESARV